MLFSLPSIGLTDQFIQCMYVCI